MKRHGFSGMPASHGTGPVHRSLGATGARQDPGKVWKGQKMPGRMGGKRTTHQHLLVYEVDVENKCILLKGTVPGKAGVVRVKDALYHRFQYPPPFPTFTEAMTDRYKNPNMHDYRLSEKDPIHSYYAKFPRPWSADLDEKLRPDLYERLRQTELANKQAEEEERRQAAERAERLRKLVES